MLKGEDCEASSKTAATEHPDNYISTSG